MLTMLGKTGALPGSEWEDIVRQVPPVPVRPGIARARVFAGQDVPAVRPGCAHESLGMVAMAMAAGLVPMLMGGPVLLVARSMGMSVPYPALLDAALLAT